MALRLTVLFAALLSAVAPAHAQAPPQTGFEARNGAAWTTHAEELTFLQAVQQGSPRVALGQTGATKQGRPLHLVELGHPAPAGRDAALNRPTALVTCTQHGNEPAGREACLKLLRDLAFTQDPKLTALLAGTTFLFIPTANPDGREANTRGNSDGTDINRDHITLATPEARAMAAVVRDWGPDVALDLHEYGPSMPVVYDDSVLWLWPRNLNTDSHVHDLAIALGRDYLVPGANAAGYTTDEYGQYEIADNDVQQTAGDADEGIMRNAMGLRHALGILVETRVDADPRTGPQEAVDTAALQRRRVDSHMAVLGGLVRFLQEKGALAAQTTREAAARKQQEGAARSAPVYFGGADNQEPTPDQVVNPPPCGYQVSLEQAAALGPRPGLLGIAMAGPFTSLAQPAEPLIPLLLDARGARHVVQGTPLNDCPGGTPTGPVASPPRAPSAPACTRRRGVLLRIPTVKGRVLGASVRVGRRGRARVRRTRGRLVASVRLRGRPGSTVRVRIVVRARRGGKVRRHTFTRTYRLCRA